MKRTLQISIGLLLMLSCAFWISCWHRGPTEEELYDSIAKNAGDRVTIDTAQSDVGVYWVRIEREDGSKEEYGIEGIHQWTWPWEKYDFSK